MISSTVEIRQCTTTGVSFDEDSLIVDIADGRAIQVPLTWFPRLAHSTAVERHNWRLLGLGEGIHWPDLDEDIAVSHLLAGRRSAESPASFQRWLKSRQP